MNKINMENQEKPKAIQEPTIEAQAIYEYCGGIKCRKQIYEGNPAVEVVNSRGQKVKRCFKCVSTEKEKGSVVNKKAYQKLLDNPPQKPKPIETKTFENIELNNPNIVNPDENLLISYGSGRKQRVYKMKGIVSDQKRVENKTGLYVGSYYYVLTTKINWPEEQVGVKPLLAFKGKMMRHGAETPPAWEKIEGLKHVNKEWVFSCTRYKYTFRLIDMEEWQP